MGKVSDNFTEKELSCHCGCGTLNVDYNALRALELFREHLGISLIINSACRCERHNQAVGGAVHSWHLSSNSKRTKAFDLRAEELPALELLKELEKWDICTFFSGRGYYPDKHFIHLDTGHLNMTRWIESNGRKISVASFPEVWNA